MLDDGPAFLRRLFYEAEFLDAYSKLKASGVTCGFAENRFSVR